MSDDDLVVDASVLVQLYVRDEEDVTEFADEILRRSIKGSISLVAPQVILYEVPSAVRRSLRRRRITPDRARSAIRQFFNLRLRTIGTDESLSLLIQTAYDRAAQLDCHLYDGLYVVTAESLHSPFITADRKLYRQVRNEVANIVWIEDYEPAQ